MSIELQPCISFPESVFPMGGNIEDFKSEFWDDSSKKTFNIGSILCGTPKSWVKLPAFQMSQRMISNREYLNFFSYEEEGKKFVDDPAVWKYVWASLKYSISSHVVNHKNDNGQVVPSKEDYSDCNGYVDAYINSIQFEIERILQAPFDPAIKRLFAFIKYKMRYCILEVEEDDFGEDDINIEELLNPQDLQSLSDYQNNIELVLKDHEEVYQRAYKRYGREVDKKLLPQYQKGRLRIESLVFLSRFKRAFNANKDLHSPVLVSQILYPRYWSSMKGAKASLDILKVNVPWEDQPVYGITLYEALLYTIWLTKLTGKRVFLPNEAEYERSSSWPIDTVDPISGKYNLTSENKSLYPWEESNKRHYNQYFGNEGKELEADYFANKQAHDKVLNETSRQVATGKRLEMLVGFGWHWTLDRYDPLEQKYSRFKKSTYPKCEEKVFDSNTGELKEVFEYQNNNNINHSYYVLKGSPDVIGGGGITTRRYAAFPMRAYHNIGFRYVVKGD